MRIFTPANRATIWKIGRVFLFSSFQHMQAQLASLQSVSSSYPFLENPVKRPISRAGNGHSQLASVAPTDAPKGILLACVGHIDRREMPANVWPKQDVYDRVLDTAEAAGCSSAWMISRAAEVLLQRMGRCADWPRRTDETPSPFPAERFTEPKQKRQLERPSPPAPLPEGIGIYTTRLKKVR